MKTPVPVETFVTKTMSLGERKNVANAVFVALAAGMNVLKPSPELKLV
jgi:hypothetical protein